MDAMLGSLARKLRAFGVDSLYYKHGNDEGLIQIAREQGRVVVTADRALAARARSKGVRAVLVIGISDSGRIASMAKEFEEAENPLRLGAPRCSVCNGTLQAIAKRDLRGRVPRASEERHRLFYACSECGKVYWKGSHWKKLRSLERRLREKSIASVARRGRRSGPPR
ncbi:MAG: hypothetical protein HY247_02710 [archaeon]|nr:MAG: hypothetical protein HY247_02710 [archaeon]